MKSYELNKTPYIENLKELVNLRATMPNEIAFKYKKKNLIILSNGKNVSPEELEGKIQLIENVIEVLIYAENDTVTAEIYAENADNIQNNI